MLEQNIQTKIIKYLKSIGAYVVKTMTTSRAGVPDLLVCYNGFFYGIEVKTETGIVSDLQNYNLKLINKAGGIPLVVRSLSEVKELINNDSLRTNLNIN